MKNSQPQDEIQIGERLRQQTEALMVIAQCPSVQKGDIHDALPLITKTVADVLGVRYVNILQFDELDESVTSLLLYDHRTSCQLDQVKIPASQLSIYLDNIRKGAIIDASDARNDSRINEMREIYMEPMGVFSMLDAGFRIGREINGVLCIASTEPREWRDDEIRFVVAVTAQISLTLSNREMHRLMCEHERLNALTCQDPLTCIGNRRLFDRNFQQYWNLSVRNGSSLTLVLIDLDYFKSFNDNHGHMAGDSCLRQVASLLREILQRQSDVIARIGGEEFAVLLPDTDTDGAVSLIQQMLLAVSNTDIRLPNGAFEKISFSAGLASHSATSQYPDQRNLFEDADKALYQAKASGRGRLVIADGPPPAIREISLKN